MNFKYTPSPSLKNVFEQIKDVILSDGFYVVCDRNYTATVRNIRSFLSYLNNSSVDETFGEITQVSSDQESHSFYAILLDIIGQYKGFSTFNTCKHTFVECTEDMQTVSIKTKGGKRISVAVLEKAGCVDIHYGDSSLEKGENGSEQFEIIGFNGGGTPVKKTPVTLTTIML